MSNTDKLEQIFDRDLTPLDRDVFAVRWKGRVVQVGRNFTWDTKARAKSAIYHAKPWGVDKSEIDLLFDSGDLEIVNIGKL